MDRSTAKRMIELLLSLDVPLNEASALTETMADTEERRAVRRALGEITARAYTDLIRPIVHQFPDLDPEKSRSGGS